MRARTSPLWKPTREEFAALIARCETITEVLADFGLPNRGGNSRTFHKRVVEESLDISPLRANRFRGPSKTFPLETLLCENSAAQPRSLKRRLLRSNLLTELCERCGLGPEWNGSKLVLHLDHRNGDRRDNRLENLRLLCPNCHSQTDTYAGRNQPRASQKLCAVCGNSQPPRSAGASCHRCASLAQRRVERPESVELQRQVRDLGYVGTARLYGVSDNAIRKWLQTPDTI